MGDTEPIEHIMRKIKRKWDEDKENWKVLSNLDRDGNQEMLISQDPNTYWLKSRTISAHRNMSYGQELTNLDTEIDKKLHGSSSKSSSIQSEQDLVHLFGMMVPTKKDILYTGGVALHSPKIAQEQKSRIDEKDPHADAEFRKYLRKKYEREYMQRNGMYL